MIRVNLLKTRATAASGGTSTTRGEEGIPEFNVDAKPSQAKLAVKLLLFFAGAGLLHSYQVYNIGNLSKKLAEINASNAEMTAKIAADQPVLEQIKKLEAENKKIEDRIQLIRNLSKIRLREIKAIDYLQNTMPITVWFQSMSFTGNQFRIVGRATNDESFKKFYASIDGKSYFRDVLPVRSTIEKSGSFNVTSFEITATLAESD